MGCNGGATPQRLPGVDDEEHDVGAAPPVTPEHAGVARAVRAAVDGPVPRGFVHRVQRRATRRYRARVTGAALGVAAMLAAGVAVAPAVLPAPGRTVSVAEPAPGPDAASVAPVPDATGAARRSDAFPLLTTDQVRAWAPGARPGLREQETDPYPLEHVLGGWCSADELDVDPLEARWIAQWNALPPDATAADPSERYVTETALRWADPASVRGFLDAWAATAADCFDVSFQVVEAPPSLPAGTLVAIQLPGSPTDPHAVRAVLPAADGRTVLDVLAWLPASSAQDALTVSEPLLIAAVDAADVGS